MQTIRFRIKNHDDPFYAVLRQRVGAYLSTQRFGKYGNWLIVVKAVLYLSLYWGTYALIVGDFFPGALVMAGYALMSVWGLLIAFNISHDATHNSLTSSKLFNKIVYYSTFNPLGTDAYLWGIRHNQSHHLFPNVDGCDADIDSNFLIRLSPNRPLLPHHRFQPYYAPLLYLVYTLHWVLIKDWQYLFRKNLANLRDMHHPLLAVAGFVLVKLVYFTYMLVLPVWWGGLSPLYVVGGFLAFHATMSYLFLFTNIMNHHSEEADFPQLDAEGYLPGSWARHQISTCLDFHPTSRGWNFFFGGFNSHCAHHLFPEVCHVHYVPISHIIAETAAEFGIELKVSTWRHGLASHFRHLHDLGTIPPRPAPLAHPIA